MVHGAVPHSWCLECYRAYHRAGHFKRKAANNKSSSEWQKANREKSREATRRWRLANPDKLIASQKRSYDANAEAMRARTAAWKKAKPDLANTQNRNRRALRVAANGEHNQDDIQALFKLQNGRCAYCGRRLSTYHVDHILPLIKGGSNEPRNLQLTCSKCNLTKGSRHPLEHARLIGRLL